MISVQPQRVHNHRQFAVTQLCRWRRSHRALKMKSAHRHGISNQVLLARPGADFLTA